MRTVLWIIVAIPVLIFLFVVGLWTFVIATTRPIHPDAQGISAVVDATPSADWRGAVEQARQAVRADVASMNLPGVSVAVGVGGDIVWAEAFGWADVENQVKAAPNTRFYIGTASKMLTSAAVGMLVEQGELNLDEEIQTYVPAFPKKPWPVTLRQLMAHMAGVRRDAGDEEPVRVRCDDTLEALPRFADRKLLFEPGTAYRYSNYGWILVSGAVEAAARVPFPRFMRRHIFDPIGMDNTSADPPADASPDQSVYYFPRFAADTRYGTQGPETVDFSCFSGASALQSTPSDMVRFLTALNSGTLLKPETVQLLQTSQRLPSGEETGYGLGWNLETVTLGGQPARAIGYDGSLRGGQVSSFMIFPDRDLVIAVMSNMSFADTTTIAMKVAEAFAAQSKAPGRN
jgi:serine beta-lactamase-like protein LACTB, mitochondrial